jgi:hypothetical protein
MRFKADIGLAESRLIGPPHCASSSAPLHGRPVAPAAAKRPLARALGEAALCLRNFNNRIFVGDHGEVAQR